MGGRGSTSSVGGRGIVGLHVDMGQGHRVDYVVRNGKAYKDTGEPVNISANQIVKNAKSLGYDVKTYNQKQYAERERKRAEDRKETNRFLDSMDVQNGGNRSDQRRATISRRGTRKRR